MLLVIGSCGCAKLNDVSLKLKSPVSLENASGNLQKHPVNSFNFGDGAHTMLKEIFGDKPNKRKLTQLLPFTEANGENK